VPRDERIHFTCSLSKSKLSLRQIQRDRTAVDVSLDYRPSSLSDKSREDDQFNWYKQWYAVDITTWTRTIEEIPANGGLLYRPVQR